MSQKVTPENYDAFISYKHDSGFYMAQVIYDKLVHNGYTVFMDKHLERGKFEQQIKEAVEKSRNFILVLFPGDLDGSDKEEDWLRKEAQWAADTPNMNFIPVFCEDFKKNEIKVALPQCLETALSFQNVLAHKDYSLDTDLDKLCDLALKNANPVRPLVNTKEFFNVNLNEKDHLTVKSVDMAFHGGGAWFRPDGQLGTLKAMIERKIPLRVLVNTPDAAESIARHMRDEDAFYMTFQQTTQKWKAYAEKHQDLIQVRVCDIPLLRVYHNIKFHDESGKNTYDRIHIKYYAYQNLDLEKSFEHEMSVFSRYYKIYQDEFEFLWNASTPL